MDGELRTCELPDLGRADIAQETIEETMHTPDADQTDGPDLLASSPARYLWATLIASLLEIFPPTCPNCGEW